MDQPIPKVGSARYGVARPGKEADTRSGSWHRRGAALVEARPFTGRTHQIRVHLAHCGLPMWGLHLRRGAAPRMMLHCSSMAFEGRDGGAITATAMTDEEYQSLPEQSC